MTDNRKFCEEQVAGKPWREQAARLEAIEMTARMCGEPELAWEAADLLQRLIAQQPR